MSNEVGAKRQFDSIGNLILNIFCLAFASFQLYTAAFGNLDSLRQRSIHLFFAAVLVFVIFPASKKYSLKRLGPIIDVLMILCILLPVGYLIFNHDGILNRMYYVTPLKAYEYLFAALIIIAVLEGTRRTMGLALPIVALVALAYAFFGQHLPGVLGHGGLTSVEIVDQLYLTTEGIFGVALGVSSTYVILFIIFGAFLTHSGIADYFLDFASAVTRKSRGGPAKMSVIASGMFGSISGSAIANVVTTGQITIPMMKKIGYKPHYAGAVEAVASTGGTIMPPVMGAAVFIMSEYTGMPYVTILKHAIFPALLYYIAVLIMVHLEAVKMGIGTPESLGAVTSIKTLILRSYLFIPLIVVVAILIKGYSPMLAVIVSLISVIVIAAFSAKTRMGIRKIGIALIDGVKGAMSVAMACATAGIIVGVVSYTGLGLKFSSFMLNIAANSIYIALLLTAVATIILGMGLPATPAYIIVAALMVPAIVKLGVPVIAAHLFAFYYATLANITPPVALAAYTAAGVAESDAFKTGIQAFKLGIAAYIVPFMFIFSPSLLLIGDNVLVLIGAIITALIGIACLAVASENWLLSKLNLLERLMMFAASLLLINPGLTTDLPGFAFIAIVVVAQLAKSKKKISASM